ncbi:MAG: hypothetical protein K9N52_00370 [Verrucomicrobia bacterium]|nr:hypothetical protein [Verrucomicrobiota bacterium]
MNVDDLEKRLFKAARTAPMNETVPYAFEKRIMGRVNELVRQDGLTYWAAGLWRAAVSGVFIMLVCGVLTMVSISAGSETQSLAADLEETVFAAFDASGGAW